MIKNLDEDDSSYLEVEQADFKTTNATLSR